MLELYYPEKKDLNAVLDFLVPHEYCCVTLASRIITNGRAVLPEAGDRHLLALRRNGDCCALFHLSDNGVLLHFMEISAFSLEELLEAGRLLGPRIAARPVRCIMGESASSLFLEGLQTCKPLTVKDFSLMTISESPAAAVCALPSAAAGEPPFTLIRAEPEMLDELFPLQRGYEIEEVLPPGELFNERACRQALRVNLTEQVIMAARCGAQTVAKAGTNARGLNWDQIGGVYTLKQFRRRGLATALVASVTRERLRSGRRVALFVNLTNTAAAHAYERAGFRPAGHFRISYY